MSYRYWSEEDTLTDQELGEMYDAGLNTSASWPVIQGIEFAPSHVLKACDPVAYRSGYNDWLDSEVKAGHLIEEV